MRMLYGVPDPLSWINQASAGTSNSVIISEGWFNLPRVPLISRMRSINKRAPLGILGTLCSRKTAYSSPRQRSMEPAANSSNMSRSNKCGWAGALKPACMRTKSAICCRVALREAKNWRCAWLARTAMSVIYISGLILQAADRIFKRGIIHVISDPGKEVPN